MKTTLLILALTVSTALAADREYRFIDRGSQHTTITINDETGKYIFHERGKDPVTLVEDNPLELNGLPKTLFSGQEWRLSTYLAADMEGITDRTRISTGLGADYYFTRSFGAGLRAELDDFNGTLVENTLARLILRAPLWNRVAPYGFVEGGYNWANSDWKAGLGIGTELRWNNGIGLFAETGLLLTAGGPDSGDSLLITSREGEVSGDLRAVAGISYSF